MFLNFVISLLIVILIVILSIIIIIDNIYLCYADYKG